MSEIKTISECVNVLSPFKNIFRAAEYLEQVFLRAQGIEAETERLRNEQRTAEAATSQAKRQLLEHEKQIAEQRREIEYLAEQKSNLIDEGTERAKAQLQTVKEELERTRIAFTQQKKQASGELNDLIAVIELKKKEIAKLDVNKRDLEGGARQIEANAMAQNEKINADKRALERDVANLQAQKLNLNHDLKRMEASFQEAQQHQLETKQTAEAAHRVKQELNALQAQMEAKRGELSDLTRANREIKERVEAMTQSKQTLGMEIANMQSHKVKLERAIKKIETSLATAKHKEVQQRQAEVNGE